MAEMTHFERLGLPQRFAIDPAALERNYLERSRAVHPDHTGNDPTSLELSAALNEASTIVRDPGRRAEYLLMLAAGPSPTQVSQPPPEFLEEMLDLRMQIEEAKSDPAAKAEFERSLTARRATLLDDTGQALDSPDVASKLTAIRQTLNAVKFLNGLLRDLNEE
jgi:molecular chaperone HscB